MDGARVPAHPKLRPPTAIPDVRVGRRLAGLGLDRGVVAEPFVARVDLVRGDAESDQDIAGTPFGDVVGVRVEQVHARTSRPGSRSRVPRRRPAPTPDAVGSTRFALRQLRGHVQEQRRHDGDDRPQIPVEQGEPQPVDREPEDRRRTEQQQDALRRSEPPDELTDRRHVPAEMGPGDPRPDTERDQAGSQGADVDRQPEKVIDHHRSAAEHQAPRGTPYWELRSSRKIVGSLPWVIHSNTWTSTSNHPASTPTTTSTPRADGDASGWPRRSPPGRRPRRGSPHLG